MTTKHIIIIIIGAPPLGPWYWCGMTGKQDDEFWMSHAIIFPKDRPQPETISLRHYLTKDLADQVAFRIVMNDPKLIGRVTTVSCDLPECYDCRLKT